MSYSKRAHTFRTAVGDTPTARARLGSPSFVDLDVSRIVSVGFVSRHVAERRPACIQHRFGQTRLRKLDGIDIADDDQCVVASDSCGLLMEVMAPSVGDLGVNRPDAARVSGALRNGECGLILAVMLQGWNLYAVAARRQRLEPEVDTDLTVAGGKLVGGLALECDIPAPASVLREASGLEVATQFPRFPEIELTLEVDNMRAVDFYGARNKRYPAKRFLRAAASTEAWAFMLGVTRCRKLTADRLYRIAVQTEISSGAGA